MDGVNKIEELEKSLDEQKSIIKDMEAQLQALKADERESFRWPKDGDRGYSIQGNGDLTHSILGVSGYAKGALALCNFFRTEEEAEVYKAWLTNPRTQARGMVEMCEGFDPVAIWSIVSNRNGYHVRVIETEGWVKGMGGLNFDSSNKAQAAIDKLGKLLIRVALGSITGDRAREIVMEAMVK